MSVPSISIDDTHMEQVPRLGEETVAPPSAQGARLRSAWHWSRLVKHVMGFLRLPKLPRLL